jgi:glycosyltransferase involved in cell wall biosynthesis
MDASTPIELLKAGSSNGARAALSIAAIIPLYNGARWIEGAIRSVLSQTHMPDEIIVVDDGSTDKGAAIVERLAAEHPIITLIFQPNAGQSSARNCGFRHSKSDLIALLDQDDEWYPNHLELLLKAFCAHKGLPLGWVYSDVDEFDEGDLLVHRRFLSVTSQRGQHPKTSLAGCLGSDMFVLPSASLISREAFEKIGGFDERLSGYEDDDLFLRIFRAGYDNVFIGVSLSKWKIHPSSTSFTERMNASMLIYARKLFESYPDDKKQVRYWARDCIAPRFVRTLLARYFIAINLRDFAEAQRILPGLSVLLPYMTVGRRIKLRILAPMLRLHSTVWAITRSRRALRFLTRAFDV